jgi:hypothetical protein
MLSFRYFSSTVNFSLHRPLSFHRSLSRDLFLMMVICVYSSLRKQLCGRNLVKSLLTRRSRREIP